MRDLSSFVIQLRAVIICLGDLVAGILVGWFPRWHSSASLVKYGHLVGGHWSILGLVLLAAAALVAVPKTRSVGYGISSFVYLLAAAFLAYVSVDAKVNNALAVVGLVMLGSILLCGVATAQQDRGRRDAP